MDKQYYYLTRHNHNDRVVIELNDDEVHLWESSGRILEPVMKYDSLVVQTPTLIDDVKSFIVNVIKSLFR